MQAHTLGTSALLVLIPILTTSCGVSTSMFVLEEPLHVGTPETFSVDSVAADEDLDRELRTDFESAFSQWLIENRSMRRVDRHEAALRISYEAVQIEPGSGLLRIGSKAVEAAVGQFSPVSLPVGEEGGGSVGVELRYYDARETLLGRVLVGAPISGLLATTGGSLTAVAETLGKYTLERFKEGVAPASPEVGRQNLLEAWTGEWDETLTIHAGGSVEPQEVAIRTEGTLEADGRVLLQKRRAILGETVRSWIMMIGWDSHAHAYRSWSYESNHNAFVSGLLEYDEATRVWTLVSTSKGSELTRMTFTFSEDLKQRTVALYGPGADGEERQVATLVGIKR